VWLVHGHLLGAKSGQKYGTKFFIAPKNAAALVLGQKQAVILIKGSLR